MSRPWFVLASGPSQRQEDVDAVRGRGVVVAINNTLAMAPWADILYSCDARWFRMYSDESAQPAMARILREFRGERVSSDVGSGAYGARVYRRESGEGLGRRGIRTGHNSGYQAINLAWLRGARTIVLLGLDMQHTGGQLHWHSNHPYPMGNFGRGIPELCVPKFDALASDLRAEGVRVINCTRSTALRCFERMPLQHALEQLDPA